MPKTASAPILLLTTLLCLCLNRPLAQANELPTQEHQLIFPVDCTPLKLGAFYGGQPLVPVTINDTQMATFLVDTGTTDTIITTELAKKMNIPLEPGVGNDGKPALWQGKPLMTAKVSVLTVGSIRFAPITLVVVDARVIGLASGPSQTNPYQGILGSRQLQHFAILLDGRKHTLGFIVPGNLSQNQLGFVGFTQPYALPMTNVDADKWFIPAQFMNSGLRSSEDLLLDTGSDGTEVSKQLAQRVNLKAQGQRGNKTAYGDESVTKTATDELKLGDLTLPNVPLVIRPISEKLPPTLGMDILSSYRVLMDFPGKKMYLQSNTAAAIPSIKIGPQAGPKP